MIFEIEFTRKGNRDEFPKNSTPKNEDDNNLNLIDIKTLEQLMNLEKEYGELIITHRSDENMTPIIEIYNDYRE